jgi:hypothetical protein
MRSSVCFGGEQLDTGRMMMRRPQQAERGAAISLDVCARGALVFACAGGQLPTPPVRRQYTTVPAHLDKNKPYLHKIPPFALHVQIKVSVLLHLLAGCVYGTELHFSRKT